MTYYYVHGESGSAFLSDEPPAILMASGDGQICDLTDRIGYERACQEFDLIPEPHPDPCHETRRRIRAAVAAWAYEVHDDPIMSDSEFDALARSICVDRSTRRGDMDAWFLMNFNPSTGVWVHQHPEKDGLERIYQMLRPVMGIPMSKDALMIWMVAP